MSTPEADRSPVPSRIFYAMFRWATASPRPVWLMTDDEYEDTLDANAREGVGYCPHCLNPLTRIG